MIKKIQLLFITIILILGLQACTPSSQTVRFNKERTESKDTTSSLRFTSNNDNEYQDISYKNTPDTTNYYLDDEDEFDEEPTQEETYDLTPIFEKYSGTNSTLEADLGTSKERFLMEIIKYMNTPYKYGGNSNKGIDCSAFTQNVYSSSLSVSLLRSAREQFTQGKVITDRNDLIFGDLVFFNTRRAVRPGHVGIYLGDNLFVHASRTLGVTVSSMTSKYYNTRYMGARRLDNIFTD